MEEILHHLFYMKFYETWLYSQHQMVPGFLAWAASLGLPKMSFFCGRVLNITLKQGLNMMDLFSSTGLLGRSRGAFIANPVVVLKRCCFVWSLFIPTLLWDLFRYWWFIWLMFRHRHHQRSHYHYYHQHHHRIIIMITVITVITVITIKHQINHHQPSTINHQWTISQPSINHQSTIKQPSINHQSTINEPSINHHQPSSTINQPSSTIININATPRIDMLF